MFSGAAGAHALPVRFTLDSSSQLPLHLIPLGFELFVLIFFQKQNASDLVGSLSLKAVLKGHCLLDFFEHAV